jgi:Tetratricopeptide repeat
MKLQRLKSTRLPIAAALAASVLAASAARADAAPGKLVLSGYGDSAAGEQLLAGEYAAVIERLAPHSGDFDRDEVAASTNLCVAYVASGQLDEAHEACDEAIAMARLNPYGVSLQEHLAQQEALSVAYANRAVLTRLSGE